jgi:hypothetical protein
MPVERLRLITYRFPDRMPGADAFMAALVALLAPMEGVQVEEAMLSLVPGQPARASPTTALTLAPITRPEIVLAADQEICLSLGSLLIRSDAIRAIVDEAQALPEGEQPARLPLATIGDRLAGHITHVDHTGVNLPTALVDGERWDSLLQALARCSALYRYPDGDPWPFIIPTTDDEYRDDIRNFPVGRLPKFEFVHDSRATLPVLQFSLGTDLSRQELETRLPDPYGVAFPDLGHLFRTVYVDHPWPGLVIRLDLSYAGPITDWDTGEWLVTAGGRIR